MVYGTDGYSSTGRTARCMVRAAEYALTVEPTGRREVLANDTLKSSEQPNRRQ